MSAQSGGNIPTLTVGGVTFTDLTNLICAIGATGGAVNLQISSVRRMQDTADYQVPAGKTFYLWQFALYAEIVGPIIWGYNDNNLGVAGNVAMTNFTSAGAAAGGTQETSKAVVVAGWNYFPTFKFPMPATKYPCVKGNDNAIESRAYMYGYTL